MLKKCVMCDKEFETKGSTICCSEECREKRKRLQDRDYRRKKRGSKLATEKQKKIYKKVQIRSKNIAQVNALARKAGLSYGTYVARCNNA